MRIAIIGTRYLNDKQKDIVEQMVEKIMKENDFPDVVTGDATGVDSVARSYADKFHVDLTVHQAEWQKFGKSAGPRRNALIVQDADVMYAFWDEKSPGTKNSITQMKKAGKPCHIVNL